MTTDYPDWTRLFHLVGTDITIPINITASDVTLNVNLVATEVALDVTITAVDVTLPVSIDAVTVTLDVNVVAQAANFTIEFADQSVAVFDAAKWFAHNAAQVFVTGYASVVKDASATVCSRLVPAGKVFFIAGCGYAVYGMGALPWGSYILLQVAAPVIGRWGSITGLAVIFDVPIRAVAGETVYCTLTNGGPNTATMCGEFWGWDEDA